jgi:carbon monoxide dehydrogenase subunit G
VTALLRDRIQLPTSPQRLWEILHSPESLARVLPGCQELRSTGPDTYEGTFETRVQFLTLRAKTTARLLDQEPPVRLRLTLDGRPLGLAGGFVVTVLLQMADEPSGTLVEYEMDLEVAGRLATFGTPLLRDTARRQVQELLCNLDRELAREAAGMG